MLRRSALAGLLGALFCAPSALAQSNVIPGTDVSLGLLQQLVHQGRQGAYPNGLNAVSMSTTSCNLGTVNVPWLATMQENHPFIAFLLARENSDGRFEQISNRSNVKHGFFALSNSQCIPCQNPSNGTFLGVGCSDTYDTFNNALNSELGPADEINPWLGTWDAQCSFFDAGLNPTPSTMCDGIRSFSFGQSQSLGPIGFRVQVLDQDLDTTGNPKFWYSSQYVIRGEPEANRENNMGSRAFVPIWTGFQHNFSTSGTLLEGSILKRWTGATVTSNTNGIDDGRVYVGVRVTGPVDGLWHYEYALHNRDNARGIGALSLPVCPGADVLNFGFGDIDNVGSNDWTATVSGGAIEIDGTGNALNWNTIYNVWFDSTAAPTNGSVTLTEALAGPGAPSFAVATSVPGLTNYAFTGPGCTISGPDGTWRTNGPANPGNPSFALLGEGISASAPVLVYASTLPGSTNIGACTIGLGGLIGPQIFALGSAASDGAGDVTVALPVPSNPALNGVTLELQGVVIVGSGGPLFGIAELTESVRMLFGTPSGCL